MARIALAAILAVGLIVSNAIAAWGQVVDLSVQGPAGTAIQWIGDNANARAGTSLGRADMSGDVDREDLIVGAPGAGPNGEGQVYVIFMGSPHSGIVSLSASATATLTGGAAGDQFGAAVAAGMVVRREVAPLPPRDLLVSAPAAFGGRGAVYLFPGPFAFNDQRSAAAAAFRVVGAAGDRLGSAMIATDLNGDGYRDLVMSAPGTGRIYVIFGGPSLSGTRDLATQPADVTMTAPAMPVTLAAGDFNNDGFRDLAIGAPTAANGAGAIFLVMGRSQGAFASSFALASAADATLAGIDAGDAAGTTVQAADFDGDGVSDLVISAPGGAGPGNARRNAGEAYVFWGGTNFSVAGGLATASVTIYGAAPGHRFGSAASKGTIRRDQPADLMFLAPGASANGDVDVVYGAKRTKISTTIDLAGGVDRVLRADPAGAPLETLIATQVTGKGDDIIAAAPSATAGGKTGAGSLFVVYSPTLVPNPFVASITAAQGSTATVVVTMANLGTLTIPWAARSNTSWLTMSAGSGSSSAGAQGQFTLTFTPGNLPPGTYHGGYSFTSISRDLVWPDSAHVDLTVTPGTVTTPAPTNPFGVPDPPDEGSPSGVSTPVGAKIQSLPVRDVLVTFPSVTVAGNTHVDVTSAQHANGNGRLWSPWEFHIWTTATYTGPVTIGMAYDASLAGPGVVRVWDDAGRAAMQSIDRTKNLLFATVARLPITVTIENTSNTDFNDEGHVDFLWQYDPTRLPAVWYMGGAAGDQWLDGALLWPTGIPGWTLVGAADFNGDGHPDLVWQNDSTRQAAVWYMGGPKGDVRQDGTYLTPAVPGWTLVAIADFNNDGHPDLIWQEDATRRPAIWYMGGPRGDVWLDSRYLAPGGPPGWRIVAAADFDGDGHPDLIWQADATRQPAVWYMGGAAGDVWLDSRYLWPTAVAGWKIVGAPDLDRDGHPDLVWQNDATRQAAVWYMGGAQGDVRQSSTWLLSSPPPGWRLICR